MIDKKIFKAYDVRGLFPQQVNETSIAAIAKALVEVFESGIVVIAHDGRHGSQPLAQFLADCILEEGKVQDKKYTISFVGLSTTPMFYFLVNHLNAEGGAIITASHNPKEYNGVKAVRKSATPIGGTELLSIIEEKGYGL